MCFLNRCRGVGGEFVTVSPVVYCTAVSSVQYCSMQVLLSIIPRYCIVPGVDPGHPSLHVPIPGVGLTDLITPGCEDSIVPLELGVE